MTAEDLAAAARYLDDLASKQGLVEALAAAGLAEQDAFYVAGQRALKLILLERGQSWPSRVTALALSPHEQQLEKVFLLACLDGMAIGAAATKGLKLDQSPPNQN